MHTTNKYDRHNSMLIPLYGKISNIRTIKLNIKNLVGTRQDPTVSKLTTQLDSQTFSCLCCVQECTHTRNSGVLILRVNCCYARLLDISV